MAAPVFKAGHTALITGGASGIGLALAKKASGHGLRVLVVDWDDAQLAAVPGAIGGGGGNVTTIHADVSKPEDWAKVKSVVDADFGGKINLLALNAGIGRPTSWEDPTHFQAILDVNLWGVIHGITTMLPAVKAAAAAAGGAPSAVVITGSKQGITNPPGNPAYNASKAAVRTLAEHLAFDLRAEPNLSVHLLVPGWTFTALTGKNAPGADKEKPPGAWLPEQVVDYLDGKMAEGKFYVLCPDNDVTEETDKKRMLWSVGDLVEGRPPLTRWRDEWKGKAQEWMDSQKL